MIPSLALLALIDSTSFGTLLIPVWLLIASGRVRVGRFLIYILTVAGFYFGVGLIIMLGADTFLYKYDVWLDSYWFLLGQLILGVAFMVISQLMDTKKARARAAERTARGEGRILKWRNQVMSESATGLNAVSLLIGLALTAALIELGTMLPYLTAIGLIASEGPSWPISGILLLGYCLVMVLPAFALLLARLAAYHALDKPLAKIDKWLMKYTQSTTAWIIGIAGFLLTVNAIQNLGWFN